MFKMLLPVGALLLSVALLQTGNGLQGTLLPIRAASESFSTFSIGLLGSTYFAGFILGCLFGPRLVTQVGHIRVFTAMAALASATPLAHGLLIIPMPWWVLRIITGFCFAVLYIVIESWLNERATRETRGSIFGIYLVINMTVMTFGQLTITLFDIGNFSLFAITSILVSIAAIPVALSTSAAPGPVPQSKINLKRVFAISPVGVIGCFAVGTANGSFWALAPKFAGDSGLSVSQIAVYMSITVIAGAIGQWPIGKISDLRDRRMVMAFVSLAAGIAGIALALLGGVAGSYLLIFSAIWGFVTFPLYGLAVAHANDYAEPSQFVEVSSALLLIYAAGAIAGPIVAATLMTWFADTFLYAFTALVHLALFGFIIWRSKQRESAPMEDHVQFLDALEASQSVSSVMDEALQEEMMEESDAQERVR